MLCCEVMSNVKEKVQKYDVLLFGRVSAKSKVLVRKKKYELFLRTFLFGHPLRGCKERNFTILKKNNHCTNIRRFISRDFNR